MTREFTREAEIAYPEGRHRVKIADLKPGMFVRIMCEGDDCIRIDDAVMNTTEQWAHSLKRKRNIGDFTRWKDHDAYKKTFDRVLQDLKAKS